MIDDLFQQGFRNIEDARFVRDHFIPVAVDGERWNVAVYEAHRAIELLVRGMICQIGFKPLEHHSISGHISFLYDRLPGAKVSMSPFTIGAYTNGGNGYGIILTGDSEHSIYVCRLDNGVFTQLGASLQTQLPIEGQLKLRLELDEFKIKVYLNESLVLTRTDISYCGPFKIIDRSFVRQPNTEKVRLLKQLGERLSKNRDFAYYSEQIYLKEEALRAISYMQESFDIAKTFFSFE